MSPRTVLITGSSAGGIGHALVLAFQKHNYTVFATARSLAKMSDFGTLPNVHPIALDVTSPESIAAAVKEVDAKTGGKLDVLVNNAGGGYVIPVLDTDVEVAKAIFEVNYWAIVRMLKAFGDMCAGVLNLPFQSTYNASKAAVNMLSETLHLELAPFHVRVITLMAGNVASNISANMPAATSQYSDMPTKQFAEEVVAAVVGESEAKLWKGSDVTLIRVVTGLMPTWVLDRFMIANGRGLAKIPQV
ncbi:NAD(P)-binding protein [Lentithecium fluviatile CBS 122367]|uniref:NAD(P)-binding protein n=1 Tax=Lentithecium fluviatile CBS 122367 TaxID=1168545 RepID=A0A6G1IN41_9PLEO|nr:NAD(P)-binding protein [Lentithecium fluviatile CBS 122367]